MAYKYERDLTEDEKFQAQQIKALTEAFESANKKNRKLEQEVNELVTIKIGQNNIIQKQEQTISSLNKEIRELKNKLNAKEV
jgi:predicted  nucleic acid-binding Zn-ribbon protein